MRTCPLAVALLLPLLGAPPARGEERPPLARVTVEGDGFVRLPAAELARLGFGPADDVRVSRRTTAAPQFPRAENGDVVFLALDTQGPHTRRAVYRIERAAPGLVALPAAPAYAAGALLQPAQEQAPSARPVRISQSPRVFGDLAAAERDVYDAGTPTWYAAAIARSGEYRVPVPPGSVPGATQRLAVRLHATQPGPIVLQADVEGRRLGTQEAPFARAGALLSWDVPNASAGQTVILRDLSPRVPAPARDVSDGRGMLYVESVVWEGADERAYLDGLVAWPELSEIVALAAAPAAAARLLRVTRDGTALGPPPTEEEPRTGRLLVHGPPSGSAPLGVRVFAGPVRSLAPEALARPELPWERLAGVEHLIVTTTVLREEAERLARHRSARGLASRVVAAREVYAALCDGEEDPQVLRRFLVELRKRPEGRALRYVLLCGDAALDRTDLLPFETLPALMARTQYNGATPADTLYVEEGGAPGWRLPW